MTINSEQIQALKAAAECATPGEWCTDDYYGVIADSGLNGNFYIATCSGPEHRQNKRLIAAANPAVILSLLAERDADKALIAEYDDALCKLLPGVQYMDPPDGGNVTPLDQVARMVADYRQQIAEQAKSIAKLERALDLARNSNSVLAIRSELEARTVTVKLPESVIDAICLTAAEIHNLGRGVSDERAQEIINSIRCAAGITLDVGE